RASRPAPDPLAPAPAAPGPSDDVDRRTHGRVAVEVDHVRDAHAHAAVGGVVADRGVLAGVDAVDARAAVEGHEARLQRIARPGGTTVPASDPAQAFLGTYH